MRKFLTLFLALLLAIPICSNAENLRVLEDHSAVLNNGLKTCPAGYRSRYIEEAFLDIPDSLFDTTDHVDYDLWGNVFLATGTVLEKQAEREYLVDFDGRTATVLIPSKPEEGADYTMPDVGEQANFYLLYFSVNCFVLGASEQDIEAIREASIDLKKLE